MADGIRSVGDGWTAAEPADADDDEEDDDDAEEDDKEEGSAEGAGGGAGIATVWFIPAACGR